LDWDWVFRFQVLFSCRPLAMNGTGGLVWL
jgi:hypothetical protein